jgi:hypothetical protein
LPHTFSMGIFFPTNVSSWRRRSWEEENEDVDFSPIPCSLPPLCASKSLNA